MARNTENVFICWRHHHESLVTFSSNMLSYLYYLSLVTSWQYCIYHCMWFSANTQRNKHVIITPQRRFNVIIAWLLRSVFSGLFRKQNDVWSCIILLSNVYFVFNLCSNCVWLNLGGGGGGGGGGVFYGNTHIHISVSGECLYLSFHDDVIKWEHFPRNWPFVRGGYTGHQCPLIKASDAEFWCFLSSVHE